MRVRGLSQADLARRCGRSARLISEIISGKAPIEPETAIQFEMVLDLDSKVWLGIEANYRLHLARMDEKKLAEESIEWVREFPINDLVKRGYLDRSTPEAETVSKVLSFFDVASRDAWQDKYGSMNITYRHSPKFKSNEKVLATWIRLGEIAAINQDCCEYSSAKFRENLRKIRARTRESFDQSLSGIVDLCGQSGVVLALVEPFPKMAVSGAAWWLSPRRAIIQLSARYKTDDHLWFSFFHEAAHILLHSKRSIFVDSKSVSDDRVERDANEWAANFLIPRREWNRFVMAENYSGVQVDKFAKDIGISPGIVVGRLQHERLVQWSHLNYLKARLTWKS